MSILYISYDGILEPLGQSQVLAYLTRLAHNHKIHLVSFEKTEEWADENARERIFRMILSAGITWHPLRYHKRPSALATAWDIFCGISLSFWLVRRNKINIIHARSYVASVMALTVKRLTGIKYIFDMRGFWADERVDGGLWPRNGSLFRIAKNFERRFLLSADHVVSLTYAAHHEMQQFDYLKLQMPPITVIPTCTDLDLFKPDEKYNKSIEKGAQFFKIGYVGSVNVSYMFDETLSFFKLILKSIPNARLHILNRSDHEYIQERLTFHQINSTSILLEKVSHGDVAQAMNTMDAGIFFIKKVYSKIASAPTKLGEFLGCGIPCIGNSGVGDMAAILEKEHVGVAINDFSENAMREAVDRIITLSREPDIKQRCRKVAIKHFSLDLGVARYSEIYNSLLIK
jgi:glycosyltransferase involved in cell wall biosynthesis